MYNSELHCKCVMVIFPCEGNKEWFYFILFYFWSDPVKNPFIGSVHNCFTNRYTHIYIGLVNLLCMRIQGHVHYNKWVQTPLFCGAMNQTIYKLRRSRSSHDELYLNKLHVLFAHVYKRSVCIGSMMQTGRWCYRIDPRLPSASRNST